MYDNKQVEYSGGTYRIVTPLSDGQLEMIRAFLAPEPTGRGMFDNFVLNNRHHNRYWVLDERGASSHMVTDDYLFDLWKLMVLVLAEVCGFNRNWILFDVGTPKSEQLLDPSSVEMSETTFNQVAAQLIAVVRRLNPEIAIASNIFVLMNNGPRVVR